MTGLVKTTLPKLEQDTARKRKYSSMLDQHREAANSREMLEENLKEKLSLKKRQIDLEERKLNIREKKSEAEIKEKFDDDCHSSIS